MKLLLSRWLKRSICLCSFFLTTPGVAFTASKVHFEFLSDGRYRVLVTYTVPELREVRESLVEFDARRPAEKFYWQLIRGGEFFPTEAHSVYFPKSPMAPTPW